LVPFKTTAVESMLEALLNCGTAAAPLSATEMVRLGFVEAVSASGTEYCENAIPEINNPQTDMPKSPAAMGFVSRTPRNRFTQTACPHEAFADSRSSRLMTCVEK